MVQTEYSMQQRLSSFMAGVYGIMAAGLAVTGVVAYYLSTMPQFLETIFKNPWLLIGIFVVQLALVVALSGFINRMNTPVAYILFFAYAISMGVTMSSIFLVYTQASIFQAFLVAAGMFGAMSLWGFLTKTDLSSIGNIGFMILIGLVIGMLVNLYFKSSTFDLLLSGTGVILFALLTAYDTQKLKAMGYSLLGQQESIQKGAVLGALTLYLDFVNLFLFLLRFMGKRRE